MTAIASARYGGKRFGDELRLNVMFSLDSGGVI
jgi:hypothetical protein